MSSENYETSLKRVLVHKDGYSNDVDDAGRGNDVGAVGGVVGRLRIARRHR
jgi:hypothetical protein